MEDTGSENIEHGRIGLSSNFAVNFQRAASLVQPSTTKIRLLPFDIGAVVREAGTLIMQSTSIIIIRAPGQGIDSLRPHALGH